MPPGPARISRNLLWGRTVDIKHESSNMAILIGVHLQMLNHFCGLENIAKYLVTNPDGTLDLVLPRISCGYAGLITAIEWMVAASHTYQSVELELPRDALVACDTVRALRTLGCASDAARIEGLVNHAFFRPGKLTIDQVKSLWRGLPRGSTFIHRMVVTVQRTVSHLNDDLDNEAKSGGPGFLGELHELLKEEIQLKLAIAGVMPHTLSKMRRMIRGGGQISDVTEVLVEECKHYGHIWAWLELVQEGTPESQDDGE